MLESTMVFEKYLPFWKKLSPQEKQLIQQSAQSKKLKKGEILLQGSDKCLGLVIVQEGQLRAYINSEEGKEITLYRLLFGDICILSASCMLRSINFEISIEAEKDSHLVIIPNVIFEKLNQENLDIKQYTLDLVTMRFSEVMWVMEQLVFSSLGQRLASFLFEQSIRENNPVLTITHEAIARNLGSAREVITRLLKQFQDDGMVRLSRSEIEITDMEKLRNMAQ